MRLSRPWPAGQKTLQFARNKLLKRCATPSDFVEGFQEGLLQPCRLLSGKWLPALFKKGTMT
jgi:hypothetical protein